MNTSFFSQPISVLEENLHQWIVTTYGFSTNLHCQIVQRPTLEKVIARVDSDGTCCWLRLYAGKPASVEQLEEEAQVVARLNELGVRVAPPIPRQDGHFAGLLGENDMQLPAVLYAQAPGSIAVSPTHEQAHALGRLLAQLHQQTSLLQPQTRPDIDYSCLAEAPLHHLGQWLEGCESLLEQLHAIAQQMRLVLRKHASLPLSLCHGDVQLENILFEGMLPTLIDFESCGRSACAYDLACYWRKRILTCSDASEWKGEWDAILSGYRAIRRLSEQEIAVIPALATLRAIWVMALPAEPGASWGNEWLSDREYLESHLNMIEELAQQCKL